MRKVVAGLIGVVVIIAAVGFGVLISRLAQSVSPKAVFVTCAIIMGVLVGVASDGFGLIANKKKDEQ